MQIKDVVTLAQTMGPNGLKSLPLATLLALPQLRNLLSEDVVNSLAALGPTATVGDLPSDSWIAIGLAVAGEVVSSIDDNNLQLANETNRDAGQLIICRSCKKPHWYDGHAAEIHTG